MPPPELTENGSSKSESDSWHDLPALLRVGDDEDNGAHNDSSIIKIEYLANNPFLFDSEKLSAYLESLSQLLEMTLKSKPGPLLYCSKVRSPFHLQVFLLI